ncbi:hypothetical protein B0H14DRAFT_2694239 [Mycena olivaceomarginata]|nr:hypothetical protein B0H14DRAFT_2694239 [Mycena olivaceomarginata]
MHACYSSPANACSNKDCPSTSTSTRATTRERWRGGCRHAPREGGCRLQADSDQIEVSAWLEARRSRMQIRDKIADACTCFSNSRVLYCADPPQRTALLPYILRRSMSARRAKTQADALGAGVRDTHTPYMAGHARPGAADDATGAALPSRRRRGDNRGRSSPQTQPATLCRMRTPAAPLAAARCARPARPRARPLPCAGCIRPSNPSPPLLSPLAHPAPAFHGLLGPHGLLLSISRALLGWDLLALSAPSSRPRATSVPRARRPL